MSAVEIVQSTTHATIVLNRPERRNAFDENLLAELRTALDAVTEASVAVVVLAGAGTVFSAGADLSALAEIADEAERREAFALAAPALASALDEVLDRLSNPALITIAAVNGHAVGGGWLLALACDFRVISRQAQCWFPEVGMGRAVGSSAIAILTDLVGRAKAAQIVMLGHRHDATSVDKLGLATRVVEPERVRDEASELADELAAVEPEVLHTVKRRLQSYSSRIYQGELRDVHR